MGSLSQSDHTDIFSMLAHIHLPKLGISPAIMTQVPKNYIASLNKKSFKKGIVQIFT